MDKIQKTAAIIKKMDTADKYDSIVDLLDLAKLKRLLENYYNVTGIAISLAQYPSQAVLFHMGQQNCCTKLSRLDSESGSACIQKNEELSRRMPLKGNLEIERCRHGIYLGTAPLIIDGTHLASIFLGPVLFNKPDSNQFKKEAEQFGYDQDCYLPELKAVPVVKEEKFRSALQFLGDMAEMLTETGLKNLQLMKKSTILAEEISRCKNTECELLRERDFTEAILDGFPGVFLMYDDTRKLIRWNKNYAMLTGFSDGELNNSSIFNQFPETEKSIVSQSIHQTIDIGISEFEVELRLAGEKTLQHYFSFCKFSSDGKDYLMGLGIDIHIRKRAEEALNAEYKLKDMLINSSPAYFVAIDHAGKVKTMNDAMLKKLGYELGEVVGADYLTTFIPKEDQDDVVTIMSTLKKSKEKTYQVNRVKGKDGRKLLVEWHGKSIYNEKEELDFIFGVGLDITEKEILKEQLQQSQKLEAIGQLASGVAHDFNNILTAISGYVELSLMKSDKDSPIKEYLNEVKNVGKRAANLTKQLLAFSRKQVIQPKNLNLDEVVCDMNNMLNHLIDEDIHVSLELGASHLPIKADPGQIEQMLVNLIVNARDAIRELKDPAKQKQIYIRTSEAVISEADDEIQNELKAGTYQVIEVHDTGPGISEELRKKIFDPFFTTKGKGKGTGLGLAIVNSIIKQNQGMINIYSDAGLGTTFKIYWPCSEIDEIIEPEKGTEVRKTGTGNETIMIAEDDENLKILTEKMLKHLGYKVIVSENSEAALEMIRQNGQKIDLLFTDVIMPGLNGKELADLVQKENQNIKVLFSSGYADDLLADQGILAADVNFIPKPYTTSTLSEKICSVLNSRNVSVKSSGTT